MKKLLLIAAMAAVALGASAGYNLEKVWELNTSSILTTADCRQGFGMDGKFYINDKGTQTVYELNEAGLTGNTFPGGKNCGLAFDEAGNFVISNAAFPDPWTEEATIKVVNPSTGEVKEYLVPEDCRPAGRSDLIGFAKGNMMEDGVLYFTGATTDGICILTISGGEVDEDNCYMATCDGLNNTSSTVIYFFKDINNQETLIYDYRSGYPSKLTADGDNFVRTGFSLPNLNDVSKKGHANGVFPFIWDGKEFFIYSLMPDYREGFAVAEANASAPIAAVEATLQANPNAFQANWLNAEVDANGVTIYQYVPGYRIAVYRLTKTTDYTVAGTENLFGTDWNPADTNNDMVLGEDGIYTWTKDVEMTAGTEIKFKVVQDHDWANAWPSQDYYYKFAEDGTYNLKITFNPENNEVKLFINGEDPFAEMVYTVVGPQDIFGTNWDVTDEANNMEKDEDGIYIWSKDNVALYGDFGFKVVGNHSYDIYQWPTVGNWDAHLTEGEGIYSILITFNPEAEPNSRITCTLTKTGSITPVEHTYTVAGTENLFGSNWAPEDEANDMVKGEDGIYTWTKNDVVFAEAAHIEFKVVQDHAWTYAWPADNYAYDVEAGTYNFVITFNADTKEITCVATPAGLRGDVNNDQKVDITDATTLINYLLYGDATGINMTNANCDWQNDVDISDATTLINFLLYGTW